MKARSKYLEIMSMGLLLGAGMATVSARAADLAVPQEIRVKPQVDTAKPGTEWKADSPETSHRLKTVTLYEGPPAKLGLLAPNKQNGNQAEYKFDPGRSQDVWMSCTYQDTLVTLSRPLPKNAQRCVIRYKPSTIQGLSEIESVTVK
jgi:hypothetical protein